MKAFRFEGFLRLFHLVCGEFGDLGGRGLPLAARRLTGRGRRGPHREQADEKYDDEHVHGYSSWGGRRGRTRGEGVSGRGTRRSLQHQKE
jgi:hypothetical protein